MALIWNLDGIKDWETVCITKGEGQKPKTYALIMLSMSCGYGNITEKNYVEIFERVQIYETMRGVFCQNAEGPMPITLADVRAHIGLYVNVSWATKTAFDKNLMRVMWDEAKWESRKQAKEVPV